MDEGKKVERDVDDGKNEGKWTEKEIGEGKELYRRKKEDGKTRK